MRTRHDRAANRWRGRLVASVMGIGLTAAFVVAAVPSGASAAPPERDPSCYYEEYVPLQNHGQVMSPTEPTQIVFNNNPDTIPVTFTSSQSGTVSTTATWSGTIQGGINLGIINTSVSVTYNKQTFQSATTTIGVTVGPMQVPPQTYQMGNYGVWRLKTTGTYYKEIYCGYPGTASVTAYSVTGVGWEVWQEQ